MGSIYQHGSRAIIWLGDASEIFDEETSLPVSDLFFDYLTPIAAEIYLPVKIRQRFPTR
jgi:hypothetical protein